MRRWGILTEMSRVLFALPPDKNGRTAMANSALGALSELELAQVQDVYGHDGKDFLSANIWTNDVIELSSKNPDVPLKELWLRLNNDYSKYVKRVNQACIVGGSKL